LRFDICGWEGGGVCRFGWERGGGGINSSGSGCAGEVGDGREGGEFTDGAESNQIRDVIIIIIDY